MAGWMHQQRMASWLGKMLVALSLATSCGVQAEGNVIPSATAKGSIEWSYYAFPTDIWFSSLQAECDAEAAKYPVFWASLNPDANRNPFSGAYCMSVSESNFRMIMFPNFYGPGWGQPVGSYANMRFVCPSGYNNPTSVADQTTVPFTLTVTCLITACPANSTGTPPTCTCDAGYQPDSTKTSCVPNTLTITLVGGTTTEPSSILPFNATVKDQNGFVQSGKQVTITLTVKDGTGGHIHTDNRPKGILSCSSSMGTSIETCTLTTDSSGQAPFEFIATPISGTHTITATCDGCGNTETKSVDVKVKDLITIPASPGLYALSDSKGVIGAIPGKHTDNHYLTETAIGDLKALALLYTTSVNPRAILYLNDASLVWGGLFDVGSTPWMSPHDKHDRGRSIDIRAANVGGNNEGAVPLTSLLYFVIQAKSNNYKVGLHCNGSSNTATCYGVPNNRHFHVDL